MKGYYDKPCNCGSGLPRYPLEDAAGIFCCYVCDKCEAKTRSGYNPAIFQSGTPYSATGKEEMLEIDWEYDEEGNL